MSKLQTGVGALRVSPIIMVFAAVLLALQSFSTPAKAAETRRAFLVGIERYNDQYIPQLRLSNSDAKGLGKDLEEVGFDKKNIKVVTDPGSREAFEKEFSAFLKTVEKGDTVIFFFSGHGFGIEADQTNYLLFGNLKSPFNFTKSQLTEQERKNNAVVRLRIPQYLDKFQKDEVTNGISTLEIQRRIQEKNPKTVIMILDACRTIVTTTDPAEAEAEQKEVELFSKRGKESGSRLYTVAKPPPGFLYLYAAGFGEQAVEGIGTAEKNSLFTGVLRAEMMRPGQSLVELGERVKRVVRAIADSHGYQQEPEVFYDRDSPDVDRVENVYLIGSIGRERFQISEDRCKDDADLKDWKQIEHLHKRELYERHRQRFDRCPNGTAEKARRAIIELGFGSDEPVVAAASPGKGINECDRLAAHEFDYRRPPDVPGVPLDKMDADAAIAACKKAVADNPRVTRYLFNLGRAYYRAALLDEGARARNLASARLAFDDAAKRGYDSAINGLAVLEELDGHDEQAVALFTRAAQAQHPLAMYNLGLHYQRAGAFHDDGQANKWFAEAAEKNFVPAMVEFGQSLVKAAANITDAEKSREKSRRGLEWLERAANLGSADAKLWLGLDLYGGRGGHRDYDLALLWFGRVAAAANSSVARAFLARMMEDGEGIPTKEPESAASYWRLAANGGYDYAQVQLADKLHTGLYIVKEEYGEGEIQDLLERAISQGSVRAAVLLAEIYRNGDHGVARNPFKAMHYAYQAIDLAVQADPTAIGYNMFDEINAAHVLVEMAKNGEAADARGRPYLTQEQIDRLEHYYGTITPGSKKVNIRRLTVEITCGFRDKKQKLIYSWTIKQYIWVWDWKRSESPTDLQIRNIERKNDFCWYNEKLRGTLADIFEQSKKNKVAFADLVSEKISILKGEAEAPNRQGSRQRNR
jgi:TPR repeat protein